MFLALYGKKKRIIQERKNYTFLGCWHNKINQSIMADHSLYMDMILNKRYNNTE